MNKLGPTGSLPACIDGDAGRPGIIMCDGVEARPNVDLDFNVYGDGVKGTLIFS